MINDHPNHLRYPGPDDFHDLDTLRHQAEVLQPLDVTVDIDRLGAFAPADKVEIGAITERLGSGEGLQISTDLGSLDEDLRRLREREADARLRRLLERAQQAVAEERFQSAIVLIDQALGIEATNAPALLLKGYCHVALGDLDAAVELLAAAQRHASDPQTVVLALALRAVCERQAMQRFEDELVELLENGRRDEALDRVERQLRQQPTHATLLYAQCALLLSAGRFPMAKATAERALGVVDGVHLPHFRELLHHIAVQNSYATLESVRGLLRSGRWRRAISQLKTCAAALGGDEQFEALCAYARERHARGASLGAIRWARTRRATGRPPADAALQQLLGWLLQEELRDGVQALNDERFTAAKGRFTAAERIDDRSTVVAFLHAVTIFKDLQRAFERGKPPGLDSAYAQLQHAARLAARAQRDPVVGEQCDELAAAIDAGLEALDSIRADVERARPVSECASRFASLVELYQRSPIRSMQDLITARRTFRQLADDVAGLYGRYPPHSEEWQALDKLTEAIDRVQAQLAG